MPADPRDYSFIAPIYDQVYNRFLNEGHRKIATAVKAKKRTGLKVLEIGVGSGLMIHHLPPGLDYTGIDVNERMLQEARKKVKVLKRKKIQLHIMDGLGLEFKDNSFDLVIAASVLTAVNHPHKMYKEMLRVTKKGGQIAIVANIREKGSIKSNLVEFLDPFTKKYLGFRTDLKKESFLNLKGVRIVEKEQVNSLFGIPLSTYFLLEKQP